MSSGWPCVSSESRSVFFFQAGDGLRYLTVTGVQTCALPICEHLIATNHSRQQYHEVEIGVRRDGTIVALRDRFMADLGAYIRTRGVVVPELTIALLPGPYRIPHYECEALCVLTNKTPTGTYRGPGRYEGTVV